MSVVLDLGAQPPADRFPFPADAADVPRWPLRMGLCPACGLAQLLEDPGGAEEPLGIEPQALVEQAAAAVATVRAAGIVGAGTKFAEFDSPHGGSWHDLLTAAGGDAAGDGLVDVVVDVFGLMHDADQAAALRARAARLTPGGTLLLQYHSLATIMRDRQWNALRHGHMAYYSTSALLEMLAGVGLGATQAWEFPLYGGTILLVARAGGSPDPALRSRAAADLPLTDAGGLRPLADAATVAAAGLRDWLAAHRDAGRTVIGYGAASRTVPLLVAAGVDASLLPAVADAAPGKAGRVLPGSGVPIISPDELSSRRPDIVLVFVPDLLDEVRAALPGVSAAGARWAVSEPEPHLV